MIVIKRCESGIKITGHAEFAERGRDVVCAGVSTLVNALIYSFQELTDDEITVFKSSQGQINHIKFRNLSAKGQTLIESFFVGVRMIADTFPENVRVSLE